MNKKEYLELKELIVGGFAKVDARFEKVDARFEKVEEGFEKVESRFEKVEEGFVKGYKELAYFISENMVTKAEFKEKTNEIMATLDDQSKYFQEQEMIKVQLDRHAKWINKIALKTDTKLDY